MTEVLTNPLQLSEVLEGVYAKLKAEAMVVKEFNQAHLEWDRSEDPGKGRTYTVDFFFDGFVAELGLQIGVVVTKGKLLGRDYLKDFDQAVVLGNIYLGQKAKEIEELDDDRWAAARIGARIETWDQVDNTTLSAVLPTHRFDPIVKDPNESDLPALYILKNRLILNRTEVSDFVATPPEYNPDIAYRNTNRRVEFVLGRGLKLSKYFEEDDVPGITTPAKYQPQVIDFAIKELNRQTGINQPQLR